MTDQTVGTGAAAPTTGTGTTAPATAKKRANGVAVFDHNEAARRLRWTFGNGKTAEWTYRAKRDDETACDHAALIHGYRQKIADSWAGAKTDDERHEAGSRVVANLRADVWNATATAPDVADLAEACVAAKLAADAAKVRVALAAMTKHERDGIAAQPEVFRALEKIRAERAKKIDPALLKTLMANIKGL